MIINIIEQDDKKIVLEWADITCPYCNNDNLWIKNNYKDIEVSSKKIQNFFKKSNFEEAKIYLQKM